MSDLAKNYVVSHGFDESGSAWVISLNSDLERESKTQVSLVGFDVQSAHYPDPDNLPKNIKLAFLDAFADDLLEEHAGQYDVVHVRAFSSVVKNDDSSPVIKNAYKMLKPGGYLQWDNFDGDSFKAVAPGSDPASSTISITATEDLVATSLQSQKVLNLKYGWLGSLDSIFKQHGFETIKNKRMEVKKELRSVMTVSVLTVHTHIARLTVRDGKMVGTDESWEGFWTKSGLEIAEGVSLTMDLIVAVGRKPL